MDLFSLPQKPAGRSHFSGSQETTGFNKHPQELLPLGWVSSQPALDDEVGPSDPPQLSFSAGRNCHFWGLFHVTTYTGKDPLDL